MAADGSALPSPKKRTSPTCRASDKAAQRHERPWTLEDNGASFIVCDRNRQTLAYVYYEEEPGRRAAASLLTRDEARRIASKFARLPELLERRQGT